MFPVAADARRGSASNTLSSRKRPRSRNTNSTSAHPQQDPTAEESVSLDCSFCGQVTAAVSVELPVLLRKKRAPTPYCLTCYYTTSAIRQEPKYVSLLLCDKKEKLDEQLNPMQQLFSEAYLDLHKQLQTESERAFSKQKSDPLAMLLHGPSASRRMTHRGLKAPKPESEKKKEGDLSDGGFLRNVQLPERLLRTQREQAKLQQAQIARMNQLASAAGRTTTSREFSSMNPFGTGNVYQRRKSSKKSIWNLAMDPNTKAVDAKDEAEAAILMEHAPACSCGSNDVRAFGSITSRNQDLKKGETWGMKDRGSEVVSRYQCNECGKMWNEEG
jgi:hypothetical protein